MYHNYMDYLFENVGYKYCVRVPSYDAIAETQDYHIKSCEYILRYYYVDRTGTVVYYDGKRLPIILINGELMVPLNHNNKSCRYYFVKDIVGIAWKNSPYTNCMACRGWQNRNNYSYCRSRTIRKLKTRHKRYTGPFDHKDGNKLNCAADNLILKSRNK